MKHIKDQDVIDMVDDLSKALGKVMDSNTRLFLVQRALMAGAKEKGIVGAAADNDLTAAVGDLRNAADIMAGLYDELIALQRRLDAAKSIGE